MVVWKRSGGLEMGLLWNVGGEYGVDAATERQTYMVMARGNITYVANILGGYSGGAAVAECIGVATIGSNRRESSR